MKPYTGALVKRLFYLILIIIRLPPEDVKARSL